MTMQRSKLLDLLELSKTAALEAGAEILEIYRSDNFDVELKGDDSPLTRADKAAHLIIVKHLAQTDIPVLSEEGKDIAYDDRKNWEYLWVVDPLDGTKEFIKRNGEFTVNIALIYQGKPILGVVYAPVLNKLFSGGIDVPCEVRSGESVANLAGGSGYDQNQKGVRVVASRSHLNQDTQNFLDQLNEPDIVSMGSSLKFMLLAEGRADVYPRYAPTMEWDTAAAHAILLGLGMDVSDLQNKPLVYNKENLLNPYFCAC